jgi:hypothetical protein
MIVEGHLLTPRGWLRGTALLQRGRIASVDGDMVDEAVARADSTRPLCCPASSTCTCTAAVAPTPWTPATPSTRIARCTPGMAPPACWPPP